MAFIHNIHAADGEGGRFRAKNRLAPASAALLLVSLSPVLPAQTAIPVKAGLVDYTQGDVYIADHAAKATSTHFPDIKENDVMRTGSGRAEVLLGACTAMWVGGNSSFRMLSNSLIDTRIELLTGSVVIAVGAISKDSKLALTTKLVTVLPGRKGSYRFDMEPPRLEVTAGAAKVERPGQSIVVGRSQTVPLNGATDVPKLDKRNADSLDGWGKERAAILIRASNLHQQELQRALSVDAAAAQASAAAPVSGNPRLSSRTNEGPSPIPDVPRRSTLVGYGICGDGW
jgi:hypothetical protein